MLLFNVLLIGSGSYLAFAGSLSIGSLVSFNALFITVSTAVMGLTAVTPTLLQATGGMRRVREILDERPTVVERPDALPLKPLLTGIRFEEVTFGYTPERSNLFDVTLEVPAGTRVAFVGHSGSGKSTGLSLCMRFYDPQDGRVLFDGVDLRDARLDSLYEQLGVVFQESFVSATDDEGHARRLAILEDGDFFGEVALLTDSPTTATVETLTPSTFLVLQREQLQNLMRRHEALGAQVRHALERRAAERKAEG